MATSLSDAVNNTCENLRIIFDTLKGYKSESRNKSVELTEEKSSTNSKAGKADKIHAFQLQNFWLNLRKPIVVLSTEVAKFALLLAKEPHPTASEAQHVLDAIEVVVLEIVTVSRQLPSSQGQCLRYQFLSSIESLGDCLLEFLVLRHEENLATLTGCVLEACETVVKLPSNNLEAVISILTDEEGLLVDAVQDIEDEVKADRLAQIQEEEIDNTGTWTNQDRELLPPCVGLVQTARATLKKIGKVLKCRGKCDNSESIAQLDAIADAAQLLSPAVDDFVCAMYPPITKNAVSSTALSVVTVVRQVLELFQNSHFISEADKSWLSFLLRAVDHNNNKVQPLLSPN